MSRKRRAELGALTQAQMQRRHDLQVRISLTAIVAIFALIVGVIVIARGTAKDGRQSVPLNVTESGAIRAVSSAVATAADSDSPKVVMTIYEDFQCPACKRFEAGFGDMIDKLRLEGTVAVDYQPISILDRMSSTRYSTRAANASLCVADNSIDSWLDFHRKLYEQQPVEGGAGFTDQQLAVIATQVGAPPSVSTCIDGRRYFDWVTTSTRKVLETGIPGTPTVLLNGQAVTLSTPEALSADVAAVS